MKREEYKYYSYTPCTLRAYFSQYELMILKILESSVDAFFCTVALSVISNTSCTACKGVEASRKVNPSATRILGLSGINIFWQYLMTLET